MQPVEIHVPFGWELVFNYFYPTNDLEYLSEDLVAIRLPDGSLLDLGYYPEHQSGGHFVLILADAEFDHKWELECDDWRAAELLLHEAIRQGVPTPGIMIPSSDSTNERVEPVWSYDGPPEDLTHVRWSPCDAVPA